jgi:hypothetical protein
MGSDAKVGDLLDFDLENTPSLKSLKFINPGLSPMGVQPGG